MIQTCINYKDRKVKVCIKSIDRHQHNHRLVHSFLCTFFSVFLLKSICSYFLCFQTNVYTPFCSTRLNFNFAYFKFIYSLNGVWFMTFSNERTKFVLSYLMEGVYSQIMILTLSRLEQGSET